MDKKEIREVLNFDALHEAEKLTGKSYKDDKFTESMGLLGHIANGERKREMLEALGDSHFSTEEAEYLEIVKSIGFESVLIEPFTNEKGIEERLHIMWHKEYSILLKFDTHTYGDDGSWAKAGKEVPPPSVNGGSFWYNWSPNGRDRNGCTSSGCYVSNGDSNYTYATLFNSDFTPHILPERFRETEPKMDFSCTNYDDYKKEFDKWCVGVKEYIDSNNLISIWSGDHSCKVAIKFNISQLAENGTFLKKWKKTPFLWLLHYMDSKNEDYDHEKITSERLSKLPKHVIEAINPKN